MLHLVGTEIRLFEYTIHSSLMISEHLIVNTVLKKV